MASTLSELLSGITAKCDILSRRCRDLETANRELRSQLKESEQDLATVRRELDDTLKKLNYQTIASNYDAGVRDSSRQSSKILSDLVRKIDRCIYRLEAE